MTSSSSFSFSFLFLSVHSNILKALHVPENANSTESVVPKEMGSMKDGECVSQFFFFSGYHGQHNGLFPRDSCLLFCLTLLSPGSLTEKPCLSVQRTWSKMRAPVPGKQPNSSHIGLEKESSFQVQCPQSPPTMPNI